MSVLLPFRPGEEELNPDPALIASLPAPRERQDSLLRQVLGPLLRELGGSPHSEAAWFERFNKPDWGIRLLLLGAPDWLQSEARPLLERGIASVTSEFAFVSEEAWDKWLGGPKERGLLQGIHHHDTVACLERIDAEARGLPAGSRAQFSLVLVERLLDLFGIAGAERLEFYRRGFHWEVDLGRWDEEVFTALDEQFDSQKDSLRAALDRRPGLPAGETWGGVEADRIAGRLLDAIRGPVEAILAARAAGRLEFHLLDLAIFAAHGHANRLGIHATQEATLRYLAWRSRGGKPGGEL